MATDALSEDRKNNIAAKLEFEHDSLCVFTSDSDADGHYAHYCKTILWPVFHYQIPDSPKSKAYEDHSWVYYVKVNQLVADKIVENWKRGDTVWVHDYHLLLVPAMIRKKISDAEIGFFLHTAFPSSEVFRCLATRKELLEGMLGANLVAFQTDEYSRHFLQTCNRLLNAEVQEGGLQLEERFVDVATFPIGIDPTYINERRRQPDVVELLQRLEVKYADKVLIVARDKLDNIRGVRQKLLAYELFLNQYPEFREKCVLLQVAPSTTDNNELDSTIAEITTRINSVHSSLSHQPLVYLRQDIAYDQYLAMISVADVLMITSLREGMNCTSHEYVLCQDGRHGKKKHGVLLLSEFTGSSSIFDGQLSVNPWDYRQCAEAIRAAVTMSSKERDTRWDKLLSAVQHHNAEAWYRTSSARLRRAWTEHSQRDTVSIPRLSVGELCEKYRAANRRLFFLDYEGTLAAHETPNQGNMAFNNHQRTLDTLYDLVFDNRNIVYVMSAKTPEDLAHLFVRIPGLGLVSENGCFVMEAGAHDSNDWIDIVNRKETQAWKDSVVKVLEYYRERIEGSKFEERHCSLHLHFDNASDSQGALRQAGDCASHLNDAGETLGVHAVVINHTLTVESIHQSKGATTEKIFNKLEGVNFLFVAGDAREDEPVYRWANKLGKDKIVRDVTTVSVSSRNTEASATLKQGVSGK